MAVFSSIAAAFTAISGWTITIGTLGTFAIGNFLLQTAVQLGVSALAKKFAGDGPSGPGFSIQGQVRTGGAVPRSFGVGPFLTAGSLVWHTEWGKAGSTPNAYYTQVIALSDLPVAGLKRWFIENQAVTLAEVESDFGFAAEEFTEGGIEHAWIKFHDGTQIEADPFLTLTVNETAPREYASSRVGTGIAYAIVTFRVNQEIFTGFPRSKFVLDGVPLYDVSKDDTQGGSGAHRWDDPATWGGDGDALPAVQAYNLARGIYYSRNFAGGGAHEDATIALGAGKETLSFRCVGGGGGNVNGGAGGDTIVTLKDGATVIQTWTAAGGAKGIEIVGPGGLGEQSELSPRGDGGAGFASRDFGGPDGGTYPGSSGGAAGEYVEVSGYDISALADPVLEITIGAAGASAPGGLGGGAAGYFGYTSAIAEAAIEPQWFYGLQGLTAARLPAAHWIAQIAKCRAEVEGENGVLEPIYRSAGEITVNAEIGNAFEAILTTCAGRMSEIGGIFKIYVGAPDAPIAHFEDGDIVSLAPQSFSPFFGLSETVNGVVATYPSPDEAYAMRSTPPIYNEGYEVEDGGRRLLTNVELSFVPFPVQAQRLLQGELAAARRARRHTHTLPARFRKVEPGDVVTWTSARNGYAVKQFRVDGVIDLPNCDLIVDITEVDPADHGSFNPVTDYTPLEPVPGENIRPEAQAVVGFDPVAVDLKDGAGLSRRPGILLQWDATIEGISGIEYEIRVAGGSELVTAGQYLNFSEGRVPVASGLVAATDYEVRAKYIPVTLRKVLFTAWVGVTTNDVRLIAPDIAPEAVEWSALAVAVRDQIDSAGDANASAIAAAASATVAEAEALAAGVAKAAAEAAELGAEGARDAAVASQGLAASAEAGAVSALVASLPARVGLPLAAWSSAVGAPGPFPRAPISAARMISGDADFGEAYECAPGENNVIGPAASVPFDRSRCYLVRLLVKVTNDGTLGGVHLRAGFSTYSADGGTGFTLLAQTFLSVAQTAAEGVVEYRLLIKPDTLAGLGTFTGFTHQMDHAPASDGAEAIAFHLRHNAGSATDGTARVGLFEVKDITDVIAANISAKSSVDAEQAALAYRDESGSFAGASETSRLAAEAAQGAAETAQGAAATSASNAAGSASEAGTYATNAANSATAAGDSASAASGSASLASTKAGEAAVSASAADGAYLKAQAAFGAAAQRNMVLNGTFVDNLDGWSEGGGAVLSRGSTLAGGSRTAGSLKIEFSGSGSDFAFEGSMLPGTWGAKTFRVSFWAKRSSGAGGIEVKIGLNGNDGAGNNVSSTGGVSHLVSAVWAQYSHEVTTHADMVTARPYVSVSGGPAAEFVNVSDLLITEVTAEVAAGAYAASAETSASNAASSESDAAGAAAAAETARGLAVSAQSGSETARDQAQTAKSGADGARDAAQTAQGAAEVAETAAVAAKVSAEDAAAGAVFARDVAARVLGSAAYANPIFADWSGPAPARASFVQSEGTASKRTDGKYGNAVRLETVASPSAAMPRLVVQGSDLDLVPIEQLEAVEIEIEVSLVAGDFANGSRLYVSWLFGGSGGSNENVSIPISGYLQNSAATVQLLRFTAFKPSGYVPGDGDGTLRIRVEATSDEGAGYGLVSFDIHRLSVNPITAEALASIQQNALADMQGNAEGSLVFRARAGGAEGEVELKALSDPSGGGGSLFKVSSDRFQFVGDLAEFFGSVSITGDLIVAGAVSKKAYWRLFTSKTITGIGSANQQNLFGYTIDMDFAAYDAVIDPLNPVVMMVTGTITPDSAAPTFVRVTVQGYAGGTWYDMGAGFFSNLYLYDGRPRDFCARIIDDRGHDLPQYSKFRIVSYILTTGSFTGTSATFSNDCYATLEQISR